MKKILIVEDNKDSREILGLFVAKFGHQAVKASNSQEAITYAEAECPDLILMDLDLPDADGIKPTAILKKNPKTSRIPVVAVTAWMSALSEERASRVGIVSYLIKTVSPQTLKETIEEYNKGAITGGEVRFLIVQFVSRFFSVSPLSLKTTLGLIFLQQSHNYNG